MKSLKQIQVARSTGGLFDLQPAKYLFYVLRKRRNFMTQFLNSSCQVLTKSARVPFTTIIYALYSFLDFTFPQPLRAFFEKRKSMIPFSTVRTPPK